MCVHAFVRASVYALVCVCACIQLETVSKLLAHRRIPGEQLNSRMESMHLLSSYTLDDLTAEQVS